MSQVTRFLHQELTIEANDDFSALLRRLKSRLSGASSRILSGLQLLSLSKVRSTDLRLSTVVLTDFAHRIRRASVYRHHHYRSRKIAR